MDGQMSILDIMPDPLNRDFPDEPELGALVRHGKLGAVIDHVSLPSFVGRKVLLMDVDAGVDRFRCYRIKTMELVDKHYVACLEREDGLFRVWTETVDYFLHECRSYDRSKVRLMMVQMEED